MAFNIKFISVFVCVVTILGVVHSLFEGDECSLQKNGQAGVCQSIGKCPPAIEGIRRGELPQTCGFVGTKAIVCCPQSDKPAVKIGDKSRQKCIEYSKFARDYFISPVLWAGPPQNESVLNCPFEGIELIIGGVKAKPKEFPHSAAIGYESGTERVYHCGGSLISDKFVLSAGHCQFNRALNVFAKYVRVGDLNLVSTTDDAKPQEVEIAEFIRHPEYRPPSTYNDILLIRLKENIRFNHYVRPICLYTEPTTPTVSPIATGWGTTENFTGSNDLLKVTLSFFPNNDCVSAYKTDNRRYANGIVEQSQICVGSKSEMKDTCQGDSGGPLQIFHPSVECSYYLVGVTSFGKHCGLVSQPAVYTRVSNYLEWIENNVWP